MRIRLPHFRSPRTPPAPDARVVDLSILDGGADDALTPIPHPDNLTPMSHTLPGIDPNQGDARLAITQLIADLAARGALDAGTPYVLDYFIDAQLDEWDVLVEAQAVDRRRNTARLVATDINNLIKEACELDAMRQRWSRDQATYAHQRNQLNGHLSAPEPFTSARPAGTPSLDEPAALPTAHLTDHLKSRPRPA